jgi:hypothetical protein
MELIMHIATATAVAIAAMATTGCRLDPLVNDKPGASAHILPVGAEVPSATGNPELANQIALNDGIDDRVLVANEGVIRRGTGQSEGNMVRYWSFGTTTRAPSPMYKFYMRGPDGDLVQLEHPPLVDALPGDPGYSAVHTITRVVVTDAYVGQLITTAAALADAIDLGLVEEPVPSGTFVTSPIVLPDTLLDVGATDPRMPETVYGRGYTVGAFEFGGERGIQPGAALLPTNQVSFLRDFGGAVYEPTRPIFQATIPMQAPSTKFNYTPLCAVLDVDLLQGHPASGITSDEQLFMRNETGAISATKGDVSQFQATTLILLLQIQFEDGKL